MARFSSSLRTAALCAVLVAAAAFTVANPRLVSPTLAAYNPSSLTLPFAGRATSSGPAFSVTNTGNGQAGYFSQAHGGSALSALHARTNSSHAYATGAVGVVNTTSPGRYSAGLLGRNKGTGGYGYGVQGIHEGAGPGVKGESRNGFGGEFTSSNYRGAYVRGGPSWIALYADGWTYVNGNLDVTAHAYVSGNLDVGGTCTGCTDTYPARNSGSDGIAPGDLVAAAGVEVDSQSGQPVLLVRRAGQPGDAVIGVAGKALVRASGGERDRLPNPPLVPTDGTAGSSGYLQVIVGGLAQVRVTAPDVTVGDLLAAGPDGGAARVSPADTTMIDPLAPSEDPARTVAPAAIGRAVSAPDAQGLVWVLVGTGR
ncbi:MAG TPA: hypothetical protein VEQ85_05015 [Lacipirellulaceae bacterium]|nr:hypothetical protein [Lacipirellulaceae bacterium]